MLNDVSFPPLDEDQAEVVLSTPKHEPREKPLLVTGKTVTDVELFDHPDFAASGAGNFMLLGIVGILVLILVAFVFWVMF